MKCALSQRLWLLFFIFARALSLAIEDFPSTVVIGQRYTITWSPQDDTQTDVSLLKGSANNYETVNTLGWNVTGGTCLWYVVSLPPGDDYALQVEQGPGRRTKSLPTNITIKDTYIETMTTPLATQPIIISTRPSATANLSPPAQVQTGTSSGGGLSKKKKTEIGIGIGAAIAGLCLVCGAFFLGVIVHRRSKKPPKDMEDWESGEKPQLDGKAVYGPVVVRELDARRSMQELHATSGYIPELAADEPRSRSPAESSPAEARPRTGDRLPDDDDGPISPQSERPPDTFDRLDSPVSPLSESHDPSILRKPSAEFPGPVRRDTYDDPRLVQNPWAQDDAPVEKSTNL